MITLDQLAQKRSQIRRLADEHRTSHLRVFGSVARGESTSTSDVDFLVTPETGCSLFDLGGLLADLQDLLGCRVDLVTEGDLKPAVRDRILREAVPI
jgi:uncharacterized protein